MFCLLVWFGLVEDVVSILGIECRDLGSRCWRRGGKVVVRWGLKVYVEGTCVFHMGWCREKFCEDIAGVFGCFNSFDLHFSRDIVLSDSMVAGVDAPTMFIHSGLRRDVFSSLVVGEEVRC